MPKRVINLRHLSIAFIMTAMGSLTSCSVDEVTDSRYDSRIGFVAVMQQRAATRGMVADEKNLEKFRVTAFYGDGTQYFCDKLFQKSNGGVYSSDMDCRWPDNSQLTFYAYSDLHNNSEPANTLSISDGGDKVIKDFSPNKDVSKQIDLICAMATGSKISLDPIKLNFSHCLAKFKVQAKNGNDVYTIKVKGVKFAGIRSRGEYNCDTQEWTLADDVENYSIVYDKSVTLSDEVEDILGIINNGHAFLLPQSLTAWNPNSPSETGGKAYLSVYVNIKTTKTGMQVYPIRAGGATTEDTYDWVLIPISGIWEKGKSYTYTLDFTNGAGYNEDGKLILNGSIVISKATTESWSGGEHSEPEVELSKP